MPEPPPSPPSSPSSAVGGTSRPFPEDQCRARLFALIGDEQFHAAPYSQGIARGLFLQRYFPGHRLPGMNLGISMATETLLRESLPPERRACFQGMVSTGDVADVGSTEEWQAFVDLLERLKQVDPVYRVLLFMIGNHDLLHAGNFITGWEFQGALRKAFNLGRGGEYVEKVFLPEVGARDKILHKGNLLPLLYRHFFGRDPTATVVLTKKDGDLILESRLPNGRFWQQERDGSWNALLYLPPPSEGRYSHEVWTYLAAIKLADFATPRGAVPVYFVGLDTSDYLTGGFKQGGRRGHISSAQVQVVSEFIREAQRREPNALFLLGGHYPLQEVWGVRKSGLGGLLSDPAIIAYVAAHVHARGFLDLAHSGWTRTLGISRRNPLPQIVVPAVMEDPNEMVLMDVGPDPEHPETLLFELNFVGIPRDRIPGTSERVLQEVQTIRPDLLTYDDALAHIKHPLIRGVATPGSGLEEALRLILNENEGLPAPRGILHDLIITEDVIPAMVEDAQATLRILTRVAMFLLTERGEGALGERWQTASLRYLDRLDTFYEFLWKGDHKGAEAARSSLESSRKELEAVRNEVSLPFLENLSSFIEALRGWLLLYEQDKRNQRPDLFGHPSFRALWDQLRKIPYGTEAHAFLTHVFLESSDAEVSFYNRQRSRDVPDTVQIRLSTTSGEETVMGWGGRYSRRYSTSIVDEFLMAVPAEPVELGPQEGGFLLRVGGYMGGKQEGLDHGGYVTEGGYQWPLGSPSRWFSLRGGLRGSVQFGGGSQAINLLLKVPLLIGPRSGVVRIGPTFLGGVGWQRGSNESELEGAGLLGLGGELGLFQGLVSVEGSHLWYRGQPDAWQAAMMLDVGQGMDRLLGN